VTGVKIAISGSINMTSPSVISQVASTATPALPEGVCPTLSDPSLLSTNPETPKNQLDIKALARLAQLTSSVSPMSLWLAASDWAGHILTAPGKRLDLLLMAQRQVAAASVALIRSMGPRAIPPQASAASAEPLDKRFLNDAWNYWPFSLYAESFSIADQWWQAATTNVPGVDRHHAHLVSFGARQMLDMVSPGNFLWTNPVVLQKTIDTAGRNLLSGSRNWIEDIQRLTQGHPPHGVDQYRVGHELAVTPGKVVYQNPLIELIRYSPTTEQVYPEPVLLVSAWIMKYYVLDLTPGQSLVEYLVEHGHTVYCISWKNPGESESQFGMEEYLQLGLGEAIRVMQESHPGTKIHAAGYCLGGTLLAIANAALSREPNNPLGSMTLFTAQTDFSEPGELALFIDESEVTLLEAQMRENGVLTAGQMSGAFQILRSSDLIWSRMVQEYLMGERRAVTPLIAWNADATRMPAKMHSQYLRRLFLNDDLSEGRFMVGGQVISLSDIKTPIFCVATEKDHVAPWRSVFKLHYFTPAEITFVLTDGGHNAGIANPPGQRQRHYRVACRPSHSGLVGPEQWCQTAMLEEGSWWPAWQHWLVARSGPLGPVRPTDEATLPIADAPGTYVLER
jgi:polyhydroxyalkanoate synthase